MNLPTNTITTSTYYAMLLVLYSIRQIHCSGDLEIVVTSPKTIVLAHSICRNSGCNSVKENVKYIKLHPNEPFKFFAAPYEGEAPRLFSMNFEIRDETGDEISTVLRSVESYTQWNEDFATTRSGFNVTFKYRTRCASNYYGLRCNINCQGSAENHVECSADGEKRCMQGWTGIDCQTPICSNSCNGRGTCVGAEKCKCIVGFTGDGCDECVPMKGCLHGGCANNVSFTCACQPGYGGSLCNRDLEICSRQQPCQNGGTCSGDSNTKRGFTCQCPPGFTGERCEIVEKKVMCESQFGNSICMNEGICLSFSPNSFECRCQPGFSGRFCEVKNAEIDQCGGCKNDGICTQNVIKKPVCKCATCYKGIHCEILDAECILMRVNATIIQSRDKERASREIENSMESAGSSDSTMIAITISVILLLIVIIVATMIFGCWTRRASTADDSMMSSFPSSPRKQQSKIVYKACVIDAEQLSDSEMEASCSSRRSSNTPSSPPPAYYPPIPRYESAVDDKSKLADRPTNDFPIFQNSDEATIV